MRLHRAKHKPIANIPEHVLRVFDINSIAEGQEVIVDLSRIQIRDYITLTENVETVTLRMVKIVESAHGPGLAPLDAFDIDEASYAP